MPKHGCHTLRESNTLLMCLKLPNTLFAKQCYCS